MTRPTWRPLPFFFSPTPFHDPANFSVSLAAPLSSSLFPTLRRTRILHFVPSLSVLFAFNSRYLLGSPLVSSASVLFNFRLFYLLLLAAFLPPAPTLFLRSLRISNVLGELLVIEFFCIERLPLAVNPQAHPGDVGSALSTVHRLPHDCATVIRFVGYRLLSLTRRFSTESLRKRQALSLGTWNVIFAAKRFNPAAKEHVLINASFAKYLWQSTDSDREMK